MKKYLVLVSSITGKYGKTYYKGDTMKEDQVHADHVQEMVDAGFITPQPPEGGDAVVEASADSESGTTSPASAGTPPNTGGELEEKKTPVE